MRPTPAEVRSVLATGNMRVRMRNGRRCDLKRAYPKEAFARNAAGRIFEETNGNQSLYPYKCPECREWHLTSKMPERKKP